MWKSARSGHRLIILFMSGGRTKGLLSETNKWAESGGWRLSVFTARLKVALQAHWPKSDSGQTPPSLFTSAETAVSDTGVNHQVQMVSLVCLPGADWSEPRSEVDLWTSGRGPKTPHRSIAPPAASPMSKLLLEELMLMSDPVLLNQLLHNDDKGFAEQMTLSVCLCV